MQHLFLCFKIVVRQLGWIGFLCLSVCVAPAQAATYAYRADTFAYDTPSGTAASVVWHTTTASPSCTNYPNGDDDWADVAFPGGFAFTFGGTSYSSIRVYSNGILAFPTDVSGFHRDYTSQALPITAAPGGFTGCPNAVPQNLMVAYWLDIVAGTANGTSGASVKYELLGTAPNRRFVISWVNVKLYNATTRYNFQVVLQESLAGVNGNFKYQYTTGSSTGTGAAVGVQLTTTDFTQYAYNQNFIDTTLGTTILWYPANQLAAKSAEYRFDEGSWSGAAGEVKDTSGNLQNATLVSNNVTNVAGGKLCRGATFTNNTSNMTRDAIATPIVPASQGSVDFWYKSNNAWNSSDAMLLDATTVAARPFFLLKRANGALRFAVTDSAGTVITAETSTAYSYAASTWHHIAVSWSLKAGTNQTVLQIILDGVLANTSGSTPYRTTSTGAMASLSTLYIGDNRTSGITPSGGSPNGANGTIDEVYVYALDINATQAAADMALTRTSCTIFDHFHIVHSGEVVNCGGAMASVTVEAHDASHALLNLSGTTLAMSTSTNHGTWSGISTINPVTSGAGNGVGGYTFANESSVTFGLSNTFSESLNINLLSGAISENSGTASACVMADYTFGSTCDANLNFAQAGFLYDVPHHVAETIQNITFKAVKKSDSTDACVPIFASTSPALTFTCSYTNPATGTLPVRLGGKALNATNNIAAQCDATGQAVTLAFDASGVATTTLQYADVGNMTLNAQYTSAGITMTGTDTFIAAPKDFAFSAITAAPIKAGSSFSATVTARNNAGAATPNFGKENTLPTLPEGATLSFARYQPTGLGASDGVLSGSLGAFSAGAATASNVKWSEVGTIDLIATLTSGSYLGSTLTATGKTGTTGGVGRFIPHHFDTAITPGCSAFTYSGQPFTATVTAMNGLTTPTTTVNYDGSASTTPNFSKAVTLSEANAVAGTLSPTSVLASAFAAGVASVTPSFVFTPSPAVPATSKLRAVETAPAGDGVSSASGVEGTTSIRSGRVRLSNAYGSELLSTGLAIPTILEYYDATAVGWKQGTDTCTNLAAANFAFATAAPSCATAVSSCITALSVTATGSGPYKAPWTVNLAKPTAAGNMCVMLNLDGTATGKQCIATGTPGATAASAAAPWLKFGWTSATATNPTSAANFGIYKSPLIYRRENY
jgi:MSHA biogenesis protein MshQ